MSILGNQFKASFESAKTRMRNGFPWVDERLNKAELAGKLTRTIGLGGDNVKVLTVPTTWTKLDEMKTRDPNDRAKILASLLENTIHCHEDLILSHIPEKGKLYICQSVYLTMGDIVEIPGQEAYYVLTTTHYSTEQD